MVIMKFVVKKYYNGRNGMMRPGEYRIPKDISLGDAKAARADGYGDIIQEGGPVADAPFSSDGGAPEIKEQREAAAPASPFPPSALARASRGPGRPRKS
jgi:hypothetical protein